MKKLNARLIYLSIAAVMSVANMTAFTVIMVFQVTEVGLNPLQLVLLGTTLEVTALLFEVPTGVVADVYSRRLSVIIGVFIIGVGMAMQALPTFGLLLLAQVVGYWLHLHQRRDGCLVGGRGRRSECGGAKFFCAHHHCVKCLALWDRVQRIACQFLACSANRDQWRDLFNTWRVFGRGDA